jgi:enoyl-CoA hydratase/carnithine racemase
MSEHIIVSDDGPVRSIRMNRPDKKNALTEAMYDAMVVAIEGADRSSTIRCVVIKGVAGIFSAGADLQGFLAVAKGGQRSEAGGRLINALVRAERPLVAAVGGIAVGIGTTMCLHCDHVLATPDATFSTPFARLGLVPEAGSSLLAPRLMGYQRAFSLLAMARPFDAASAQAAGLVNTIVPADELEAASMQAAREIAALPPQAVAETRRLLRGSPDQLLARIDEELKIFAARLKSDEARTALEAFMNRKR